SYTARGRIRLARDDVEAAVADVELALELARRAKDPQNLFQTLATFAHVFQEAGDTQRAEPLAQEFLDAIRSGAGSGFAVVYLHVLSWTLAELGAGAELAEAVDGLAVPWARAAAAYGRGDPAES